MRRPAAFTHIPSFALGACLFAGIERDTRGCALDRAERFNYYPAMPMAVISWIFEGTLHRVGDGEPGSRSMLGPALPRLVFSGPQRHPSVSWSPGEVHALSVAFYPRAISRLIGRSIDPYLDAHLPLEAVAPPALLHACEAILSAGDQDPFAVLEAQLQPLWREPCQAGSAPYLGNWLRALATHATHSAAGRSLRQWQRRVRDWTGQSHRDLQRFVRVEEAFSRLIEAHDGEAPNLASIAADAGFADQSHMGREVRRVTGLSPACFVERLANDEAFWYYRLIETWQKAGGKAGRNYFSSASDTSPETAPSNVESSITGSSTSGSANTAT